MVGTLTNASATLALLSLSPINSLTAFTITPSPLYSTDHLHHDHQYTTTTTTPHTITSTLHQRPNLHKLFASDDDNDNTNNSDAKSPPSSTALAANDDEYEASVATSPKAVSQSQAVFDEASDALQSVGWASPIAEGEMTSDDPFVRRIEAQIMEESGVGLEELLNPAKVR